MQMEFEFQQPQIIEYKESKVKEKCKKMKMKSKFVGVRQRPSGKWVAEIKNTSQKMRIWLGTFDTAEEAARAYDEAACLLRGSNTRTNFVNTPSSNDTNSALSRRIRNLVNQKRRLINHTQAAPRIPDDNAANTSLLSFTAHMFDDKPDHHVGGLFDYSWAFPHQFSPLSFTTTLTESGMISNVDEVAMLEFERIKVERQLSASLYAMNGVNDYLQSVFNSYDPTTPNWDPPMLYHNFCLG